MHKLDSQRLTKSNYNRTNSLSNIYCYNCCKLYRKNRLHNNNNNNSNNTKNNNMTNNLSLTPTNQSPEKVLVSCSTDSSPTTLTSMIGGYVSPNLKQEENYQSSSVDIKMEIQ